LEMLALPKIFAVALRGAMEDVSRAFPGRERLELARPVLEIVPIARPSPLAARRPWSGANIPYHCSDDQARDELAVELPQRQDEALPGVLLENFIGLVDHAPRLGVKVDRAENFAAHSADSLSRRAMSVC
jgi:hypothetical protein